MQATVPKVQAKKGLRCDCEYERAQRLQSISLLGDEPCILSYVYRVYRIRRYIRTVDPKDLREGYCRTPTFFVTFWPCILLAANTVLQGSHKAIDTCEGIGDCPSVH